jgi:Zn-finger nucleic acid-binding protein
MADHLCPGCGLRLTTGQLGSAPLQLCPACGGVWLDVPALRELLQAGSTTVMRLFGKRRSGGAPLHSGLPAGGCPHCGTAMGRVAVPDVPNAPIFACAPCRGFWLTGLALEQLASSLDAREGHAPEAEPDAIDPHACPDCGEHNPATAACCWACSRRLQGVAARECPACSGVVRVVPSPDVPLGACESCGGAWLEARRLAELLYRPDSELQQIFRDVGRLRSGPARPRHPRSRCPGCRVALRRAAVGALLHQDVETCPRCAATFVDYETLQELILGRHEAPNPRRSY